MLQNPPEGAYSLAEMNKDMYVAVLSAESEEKFNVTVRAN